MDSEEVHARVAKRIRDTCARRNLPLIELAKLAGVSRAHLFAVLAGRKSPTVEYLNKLATALQCDPHSFLKPYPKPRGVK
ncbi:MAG: helix-turn-helix transcriptional regulator [Nannocystaceae bacterium]